MQNLTRRLAAVLAFLALVGVTSLTAVAATTPTPAAGQMGGMMMSTPGAGMEMSEPFDLLFIDLMIPHHESAVAMAKIALTKGEHTEVRDLAQSIITIQQAEIAQLKAWRQAWYPNAPTLSMDQMMGLMQGMMPSMATMPGMTATPAMGGMMGTPAAGGQQGDMGPMMDPAAAVRALETAPGPFDQTFLELMIPHHQGAVQMAQAALTHATHPELKQLAQTIITGQEHEITEMQGWLASWYGAGTPAAGTPAAVTAVAAPQKSTIEDKMYTAPRQSD